MLYAGIPLYFGFRVSWKVRIDKNSRQLMKRINFIIISLSSLSIDTSGVIVDSANQVVISYPFYSHTFYLSIENKYPAKKTLQQHVVIGVN